MRRKTGRLATVVCAAGMAVVMGVSMVGCSSGSTGDSSNAASSGSNVAPVASSSSSASAGSGQLAISLELKDSLDDEYAPDSPDQFAEESLTVNVPDGATALDVLQASGREVKTSGEGDSLEIESIGGLVRGDGGVGSHWELSINGEVQRMSPNVVPVKAGDVVTYDFVAQEGAK